MIKKSYFDESKGLGWKIVFQKLTREEYDAEIVKRGPNRIPEYPDGQMDCMPDEFLVRTKNSQLYPDHIVLCYRDGSEPGIWSDIDYRMPTWKGKPGKKWAAMGKLAAEGLPFLEGQRVDVMCEYKYCIRQDHIRVGNIQPNRFTE